MKQTMRTVVLACTVAAVLCGSGCVSRRKYKACQDQLKQPKSDTAAFTVTIDNDAFAQFLPMNNQFWNQAMPSKYYGGFLVQLANIKDANHFFSHVDLTTAGGNKDSLGRNDVEGLDIVCEPSPGAPISVEQARMLVPDGTPAGDVRVIHRSILPKSVSLLTIWRADDALSVTSSRSAQTGPDHGHDQFVFSSPTACEVNVWSKLSQATTTKTYAPGEVTAIRIRAVDQGSPHGGVHQPWWFTNE